jgi:integrase
MSLTHKHTCLNKAEEATLLAHIQDPRDTAIVLLILDCQLKLGEVEALCLNHIKWRNNTVKIPKQRGKFVSLSPRLYDALKTYINTRPKTTNTHVFLTQKGDIKQLSSRGIDHIIRRYGELANIGKISARTLKAHAIINNHEEHEEHEEPKEYKKQKPIQGVKRKHLAILMIALCGLGLLKRFSSRH